MEELSSDINQERLINTLNELTRRLVQVEELIKEVPSNTHVSDITLAHGSSDLTALSAKVARILTESSWVKESISYDQGNFLQSYFRDTMTSLSIPGIKFIGERGRPRLHSYLWIFIHIVSLLISYVYIKEEYDNWNNSPVVKTISNNLTYVSEVPFPAVTVCLPGFLKDDYNFTENLEKCLSWNYSSYGAYFNEMCTFEDKASLAIASLVCPYRLLNRIGPWNPFDLHLNESIGGKAFTQYSKRLFPHCNNEIEQTRFIDGFNWHKYDSLTVNGCDAYNILTFVSSFGMCFAMNGLREKDIFKEKTVIFSEEMSVYNNISDVPQKLFYKGREFTLENMIYLNGDFKTTPAYMSEEHRIQFKFLSRHNEESAKLCNVKETKLKDIYFVIHNPVEVPFIFNSDFDLKFGDYKEIRIMPELVITEKGLESYRPTERGCFYSNERELAMFKHYSENNCKTECVANCSLQLCRCVPHYLPRHNSSVRVCLSDCPKVLKCVRKSCRCLPDCYSLSYSFEIVKVEDSIDQRGTVKMTYKGSHFYTTVRVSLTNLAQFMAYCLGIVGVFNGFSVILVFEIFYFLTFRLWNSLKSYFK